MATSAKMSYNFYQNGKYGTLPLNTAKEMEVTQDMHLKMSKKIAQLTKVIYALNTKNDEHEVIVAALKEQHEEEMQQLLSETKGKIELYKTKICNESEYRNKIETLEKCISKYDKEKEAAFSEILSFKQKAEERETSIKSEHYQKILTLSQEVLAMKRDFEEQFQKFSDFQLQVETDRHRNSEELHKQHEVEKQKLKELYQSQSGDFESERLKLEEIHKINSARLEEQCEALRTEKNKTVEEYEGKLSKAQAFYDKEFSVLKSTQTSHFESEVDRLRQEQDKMKKDWAFQESEYKHRVDRLIEQISIGEEELNSYKQQLEQLQANVLGKEDGMSELHKQVQQARDEATQALTRLREQGAELVASKHMCEQQGQDLLSKSSLIGELEATRLQQESSINELKSELNKLRDKEAWLERERRESENKQQTDSQALSSKLRSLEQSLEDVSIEKQTMKEKYEREIKGLNERLEELQKSLTSSHSSQMDVLKQQHQTELEKQRLSAEQMLNDTTNALKKQLDEHTNRLTTERDSVTAEFEKTKAELLTKLKAAEDELKRLEEAVKDSENGLGSASVHINNLKEASARLKQELDNSRDEAKQVRITAANLQAELEKLKLTSAAKLTAADHELRSRTQQLTSDLEKKWTETLRKETSELRSSLIKQKDDEIKAALSQLAKLNDEEIVTLKDSRDKQIAALQKQLSELEFKMSHSESTASESLEKLRQDLESEKSGLEEELKKLEAEYRDKLEKSARDHTEQLNITQLQHQQDVTELEGRLKFQHFEEIQGQLTAHKAALDYTRHEEGQKKLDEIQDVKNKHKLELDSLRKDLSEAHGLELEQLASSHQSQLHAARIELERSIEITKQKERDHKTKTEELQTEISQRERHVKNLNEETHKLRRQLEYLSRDLEQKAKEISKIKADVDIDLQRQEERLLSKQEVQINNLLADHLRETQEMLMEFNRAQDLFKEKIDELNILLEEAEARYRDRDSRPEDLELISHLRDAVSEREGRMKQLIDEKRYYQMELVNRETNFNKVFNSAPNVGILNPLAKVANYSFIGESDSAKCQTQTEELFNFTECSYPSCSFNGAYLPPIKGDVYAFSSFFYQVQFLNLTNGNTSFTLKQFEAAVKALCNSSWDVVKTMRTSYPEALPWYCFETNFVLILLTKGYNFNSSNWNSLYFKEKVNNADLGWALGFMINSSNKIPVEKPEEPFSLLALVLLLILFTVFIFTTIGFAYFAIKAHRTAQNLGYEQMGSSYGAVGI